MSRYKLSQPASADLDEIWSGVANSESEEFATRVVDEIASLFPMLGAMPESGRLRPEIQPDMRSFPVGDYVIYYRKAKRGGVQIWRVIHAKRNQLKVLKGPKRPGLR